MKLLRELEELILKIIHLEYINMQIIQSVQNKVYNIRGERVMLDFDLAELYEVGIKVLNQAVKRHIKRFPVYFMFQLTELEWSSMRSQIVTSSQTKRRLSTLPYAFTEQGVTMLSGVSIATKPLT